jgi:hypothetical protein
VSFRDALKGALAVVRDTAGAPVTYARGETSIDDIAAGVGASRIEQTDAHGIVTSFESRDYLIGVCDLEELGEPAAGDLITEPGIGVFQVLQITGAPCFQYSDPGRTQFRIHTKRAS